MHSRLPGNDKNNPAIPMPTALVIGASRGIGRECARQLLDARWKVFATARDAAALAALRDAGAEAIELDVTRPESLAALGWRLDDERLDLALYVAGIYGPPQQDSATTGGADFDRVMHTNVLGAVQAIPLVAPLVAAARGRFGFVSSAMGSIADTASSHGRLYRVSKAALNMAVRSAATDYPGAILAALSPGWVRTDLGGPQAPLAVEDSVRGMLAVLRGLTAADSGGFYDHDGRRLPW